LKGGWEQVGKGYKYLGGGKSAIPIPEGENRGGDGEKENRGDWGGIAWGIKFKKKASIWGAGFPSVRK